jgi:hypothetical protein
MLPEPIGLRTREETPPEEMMLVMRGEALDPSEVSVPKGGFQPAPAAGRKRSRAGLFAIMLLAIAGLSGGFFVSTISGNAEESKRVRVLEEPAAIAAPVEAVEPAPAPEPEPQAEVEPPEGDAEPVVIAEPEVKKASERPVRKAIDKRKRRGKRAAVIPASKEIKVPKSDYKENPF